MIASQCKLPLLDLPDDAASVSHGSGHMFDRLESPAALQRVDLARFATGMLGDIRTFQKALSELAVAVV